MLIYKSPVPTHASRTDLIAAARDFGVKNKIASALDVTIFIAGNGGMVNPDRSWMSGEDFSLLVAKDGAFQIATSGLLTYGGHALAMTRALGNFLLHVDRKDPANMRTFIAKHAEAGEDPAVTTCRNEAFVFALAVLLPEKSVRPMIEAGKDDAAIAAQHTVPVLQAELMLSLMRKEMRPVSVPDPCPQTHLAL